MSMAPRVEPILNQAAEQEREYDWLDAVEFYRKALSLAPEQDFSRMGEIYERLGYAFYRAAMQGESVNEFGDRMRQALANYEKAKEFYRRSSEPRRTPRILRCDAMIAYMGYWLTSGAPEKKRLVDECWRLTKESLKGFEESGDIREYGKTYNQLSISADFGFFLEWDFHARERIMREAVEHGERTITLISALGDPCELARAYVKTGAYLIVLDYYFLNQGERSYQKGRGYWLKANELSEETALVEFLSSALEPALSLGEGTDEALTILKKALEYGWKTKDKFIVGCALDWLALHTFWKAVATEDPDEQMELAERALKYAQDAKHQYSPISFISPRWGKLWVEAPDAEYYYELVAFEANLKKRRELLERALEAASDQLKRSEISGYPGVIAIAHHVFGKILAFLAKMELDSEVKKGLLEKALAHRNESIRITEQLGPFDYWNRGVMKKFLADIKSELADLAKDSETKKNMLQEAVLDKENSLKLCIKHVASFESKISVSFFAVLGGYQYEYGDLLNRLYESTNYREHLRRAAEAFEEAAESFQKLDLTSRMAECYWKAARVYDDLSEHLKAADNFDFASNNYKRAAERIPQLKDFYNDHVLYMRAWTEIEKARYYHGRQEYGLAREHFERAANLHKSLRQWGYLAANYSAWSQVEHAEELSRKEQCEEAAQAFEQAAKLFNESKKSLYTELSKIENMDEKHMATSMAKATDLRYEYCIARMALEEAKILDKRGDHYSSSEKYGSSAESFWKISQTLESERDLKEFKLIISLSRAWQKMTRAEAEASPALYLEASQLFEEAKEYSPNEQAKMLALGHSRFCRALEAGAKFADTRDISMYANAMQYLESAANYYVKADFQKASEFAKATGLLFDAYVHMDNAKKENDPEKKAKLCMMAEKILQASAGAFMKAEHPGKTDQVLRLLEKVKEERELAVSLIEVLHAPSIVSSTTSFATLTSTHEEAVGLEKFEHADIQANIITRQKELQVGENLDLEIELVNAGKGPALLMKVAEVIPKGFELMEKPENYRLEDGHLNLKGKRLDPLKTEEVRLVLKPKARGVFPLKPRILYLDENGKDKSHEPEPINITVKELGIKGWLKGER